MKKSEINELDDNDLQLRYYLGGLTKEGENQLCDYWRCSIDCSCSTVPDDERLVEVKNFINTHNLTNECFLRLSYCFLKGCIMKYKGTYSPFFIELEKVIKPYNFVYTKSFEIPDSDFREKELENIVNDPIVKEYCSKYQLTVTDFIILAKTSINYNFYGVKTKKNPDGIRTYELHELNNIIDSYGLYVSRAYIEEYRARPQTARLIIDIKVAQKKYLELLKELQTKNLPLATLIISNELSELGFHSKKDIKKLIL